MSKKQDRVWVNLSKEEAATIVACFSAIKEARTQVEKASVELGNAEIQAETTMMKYGRVLDALAGSLCEREGVEKSSVSDWDLSKLNTLKFEGEVGIPKKNKEQT